METANNKSPTPQQKKRMRTCGVVTKNGVERWKTYTALNADGFCPIPLGRKAYGKRNTIRQTDNPTLLLVRYPPSGQF